MTMTLRPNLKYPNDDDDNDDGDDDDNDDLKRPC